MRSSSSRPPIGVLILLSALLLLPQAIRAEWSHDPNENAPISVKPQNQDYVLTVTDGAGGAIMVWEDFRSGIYVDVYMQRVDASGTPLWTTDGVAVCAAAGHQGHIELVADGSGGAFAVWLDLRSVNPGIYIQQVNSNGVPQWTANGVALTTHNGSLGYPVVVPDGSGGAIAAWQRSGASENGIYVQKVNSSGLTQWTSGGVLISDDAVNQVAPDMAPDGAGGAVVAWEYYVDPGSAWDIYAQRVNGSGMTQWTAGGVVVAYAGSNQNSVVCMADGNYGFILVWTGDAGGSRDIYVQKLDGAGGAQWYPNGFLVCGAPSTQINPDLTSDDSGGAIITWQDYRDSNYDIYAQRVSGPGACLWTSNGIPLCTDPLEQSYPKLDRDGEGGAIVTWMDARSNLAYDIYAQRVNSVGMIHWPADGMPVSTATNAQQRPDIVRDDDGGAIIAWHDYRSYTNDVYCQRIELGFGELGRPEPAITGVNDVPNDQGGQVNLTWDSSYLDTDLSPTVDHYWVFRSTSTSQSSQALARGARVIRAGDPAPESWNGCLLSTVNGAATIYWEYLDSVPARHMFPGYSYLAATAYDSTESSNPSTFFMVAAMNADDSEYWMSHPDSGYSVDDLAPAAPDAFTGEYLGPTTALHWLPNTEFDFLEYRLYRSKDPDFIPGAGNFVAALPDTGYLDVAGETFFYRICAVDVHGNLSPYAFAQPDGTVDIEPGADLPASVRLYPVAPNPIRGQAVIHFDLPSATAVKLTIYNARGRVVREVLDGQQIPAGSHTWDWNGRDDAGARVAHGVYFITLQTGDRTVTRKAVVMD